MSTNQPNRPNLTVIPGEGNEDRSLLGALTPRERKFVTRFVPFATAVGLAGTLVGSNAIDNSGRNAVRDGAKARAEAQQNAASNINSLHAEGKDYTVRVQTGDGAESLLNENEPGYNASEALRAAAIEDIEDQAPEDTTLQTGQDVKMPDLPGGNSAPSAAEAAKK